MHIHEEVRNLSLRKFYAFENKKNLKWENDGNICMVFEHKLGDTKRHYTQNQGNFIKPSMKSGEKEKISQYQMSQS